MDFDALVFDLDGTLWDVTEACAIGWNNALRNLGISKTVTVEDIRRVTGKPLPVCVEILLPDESEIHQDFLKIVGKYEEEAIQNGSELFYDSLKDTIKTLSQNFDLYLVSNCQGWYLDLFFKLSGVQSFFKGYDCFGVSHQYKAEMLINLKQQYSLEKPAYVGDTEVDEEAAVRAGYTFIFASYGFGKAKQPDITIKTLKELTLLTNQER